MTVPPDESKPDRVFQTYRDGDLAGLAADLMDDDRFSHEYYPDLARFDTDRTTVLLYDDLDIAEVRTHSDEQTGESGPIYDLEQYGFEHERTTWYNTDDGELLRWGRDRDAQSRHHLAP